MISFDLVPNDALASGTFIEQKYKRSGVAGPIPQRVAILAQYNDGFTPTANVAQAVTSVDELIALAGPGSMAARIGKVFFGAIGSASVDVDWFPIGSGTGTAAGTIAITGPATSAGTLSAYIGGELVSVAVENGDTAAEIATALSAAINAAIDLPVTAAADYGDVDLTAKWVGLSGNQIDIRMDYGAGDAAAEPSGLTINITAMTGGSANPSIETALTNFAGTFYTKVICPFNDDTQLDLLEAAGAARIEPAIKKPFAGFVGYNGTRANYLTFLSSRNSPWTTSFPVENSPTHPAEIAASLVGKLAVQDSSGPGRPGKNLPLYGVKPGNAAPWTYAQRDAVVTAGGSTSKELSGTVFTEDVVTTYVTNPLGAVDESWRYTATIANVQAKLYSLDALFAAAPYDNAVVVDDNAVTSKEYAVSPKRVKTAIIGLIDGQWIPEAWSKERDAIVAAIEAEIDSTNPGRINVLVPDIIAVGLRIMAVKYQWSFGA